MNAKLHSEIERVNKSLRGQIITLAKGLGVIEIPITGFSDGNLTKLKFYTSISVFNLFTYFHKLDHFRAREQMFAISLAYQKRLSKLTPIKL
jgi:hypothetical protein